VTDKISTVLDALGHLSRANTQKGQLQQSRLYKFFKVLMTAAPPLLRSVVLGTALFSVYDYSSHLSGLEKISNNPVPSVTDFSTKSSENSQNWIKLFFLSAGSGGLAGGVHGVLYYIWGKFLPPKGNFSLGGAVVSHGLVHCSLFMSYEMSKRFLMSFMNVDYTDYGGAVAVAAAGGISGILQEFVNYYTFPFEDRGINKTSLRVVKNLPNPSLRTFLSPGIILPSMIGFLAYEYSKEIVLSRETKD